MKSYIEYVTGKKEEPKNELPDNYIELGIGNRHPPEKDADKEPENDNYVEMGIGDRER